MLRTAEAPTAVPLHEVHGARDILTVRGSIASWLLDHVQIQSGAHRGGVAGSVNADGGPIYVYPEIAGYFLQWLAWLRTQGEPASALATRAASCQDWLRAWIDGVDPPQTRLHIRAGEDDWRNGAIFFFDLAMVLRGLASAAELALLRVDERLAAALIGYLSTLISSDGMFVACRATSPQRALPARWSTRRGGFLAKAAAGILGAAEVLPQVPPDLRSVARRTLAESLRLAMQEPHANPHPLLYAIEGALAPAAQDLGACALPVLAKQIDEVLIESLPHGLPRESATAAVRRLDAGAQCLRAAYLLRARVPDWLPEPYAMHKTLLALLHGISDEGSLPFACTRRDAPKSVWTAMFAEQALTLAALSPSDPFLREASRWIV
jgi:hypothetical protein